ncbi:hypothetical protein KEM52_005088, partial [Ascosphaera acerosa]
YHVFQSEAKKEALESQGSQLLPVPKAQAQVRPTHTLSNLPQCDKLIGHFINHIDIMYHAIHVPTFLSAYQALWSKQVADVDLIWLALLFTIISATALLAPQSHVGALGLEAAKARELAMLWYDACRQSLFVGDYEARPTLTQIQVFLCTQTYWLETKNYEVLNSQLGQAVRNAQALGIDKDQPGAHVLETELRRRAFWELWVCDAYQSLCLDRTPLLSASPNVPKPVHCNDSDVTEDRVIERPLDEVTDMSANLAHYSIYIALRQGSHDMSSYEQVKKIDEEMKAVVARFPWYFQSHDAQNTTPRLDAIAWQYNILHMGISLLRIRINRPFMHAKIGDAWYVCADAAQDILLPYRRMRQADPVAFLRSPKFVCQAYQAYTAAVAVAAFLLVERALPGLPSESMLRDVEMVINDLETSDLRPMLAEGVKVLRKMVRLFLSNQSKDAQARESIVTEIASVFGGEQHTRNYLKPRSPEAAPHARQSHATTAAPISAQPPFDPSGLPTSVATATFPQEAWPAATLMSIPNPILQEGPYDTGVAGYPMTFDFQAALDMLNCDQWFDFVMPTGFNEQHSF